MPKTKTTQPNDAAEQAFLASYDAALYPHPSVTVDVALVTADQGRLKAVLVQREEFPERGRWSLPGGFVLMEESLDAAAARILQTKVGVGGIFLEQLYTFGEPQRDPRTRIITVAYYALVDAAVVNAAQLRKQRLATLLVPWKGEQGGNIQAVDDNGQPLLLAFDHAEILGLVVQRLRGKLNYAPIGFELLPPKFTLRQLQEIHETILGHTLNKDSFRRRLLASELIVPTGKLEAGVGHRPAELYQFRAKRLGTKARKSKPSVPPHSSQRE